MHLVWACINNRASLIAQLVKNLPAMQETLFESWDGKIHWRSDRLPTPVFLGFPGGSDGKESTCNAGDLGSIPGFKRSPGGGHGNTLQCSCLESPWTEEPGRLQSLGPAKSWTHLEWLSTHVSRTIVLIIEF